MRGADLRGLRAGIVGAAREGTALARYLVRRGARVTLADIKPASDLGERLSALQGLGLAYALGGQPLPLAELDVLFVSPGVPPTAPVVREARERGLPISSEPRLFTQLCPAPVVGITGSSGKTTTTALTGEMFGADGRRAWVGGNIGVPLIERLDDDEIADVAVMELSSFQLELFSPDYQGPQVEVRRSERSRAVRTDGWSPHVAAVTNVTPNHLDRHASMDAYARIKGHVVAHQGTADWAVLNRDDERSWGLRRLTPGRVLAFSLAREVEEGGFVRGDDLVLRLDGREAVLCPRAHVRLRGAHNLANVLTAACCALAGGVSPEAMRTAIAGFAGMPHRLELVRVLGGVSYVNDSIATSPERAVAALRSYEEPLVLLAGGRDKHLPWEEWAGLVHERARVVIAFGEAVPIIERALRDAGAPAGGRRAELHMRATMEEAVALSATVARRGDVVLLSPGGTSFDAYTDYEERGRAFRDLVSGLQEPWRGTC